jgi:putative MATE family efflux protein
MQTVFGVVRGVGDTATPMYITIIMNIINVVVGYLLIFPFEFNFFGLLSLQSQGFGIFGAALSLTTARFVGMSLAICHVMFRSKDMRFNRLSDFKPDFAVQKSILEIGIPTSIESSMFQVGRMITQLYVVGMGTASLFANSVTNNIFNFINVPGNAFSIGVMILVGNKVGRGEYDDIKKSTLFAAVTGCLLFAAICLTLYPMTGLIISVFNAGPESAPIIKSILLSGFIATPIFWSPAFVIPAGLRAVGDVKFTMILAISTMWTLRIGLGYVMGVVMGMGVIGVWFAMYTDWVVRAILFTLRLLRGKWMKRLPALN